jgi:hypothetical protein
MFVRYGADAREVISPSGMHQDAIHLKQIHHQPDDITGVDGSLSLRTC